MVANKNVAIAVLTLVLLVAPAVTLAQGSDERWEPPVNLSTSGAASAPTLLTSPGGATLVYWPDQFDGLTVTGLFSGEWLEPVARPLERRLTGGNIAAALVPASSPPDLFLDSNGTSHALWVEPAETRDPESRIDVLYYSRRASGEDWAPAVVLDSAILGWELIEDVRGVLHLFYLRGTQEGSDLAGLYYLRSVDGGAQWGGAQKLFENVYMRLITPTDAHLAALAGAEGRLHLLWDVPRLGQSLSITSDDGGTSWSDPEPIGDDERQIARPRLARLGDDALLRLYESTGAEDGCRYEEQRSADGGASWTSPQPVLEALAGCQPTWRLLELDGSVMWVGGEGSSRITLAFRGEPLWSSPRPPALFLEDPESGRQLELTALRVGWDGNALRVVGEGIDGEIWATASDFDIGAWARAPRVEWSDPQALLPSPALVRVPSMAADAEGQVHLIWSEAADLALPGERLRYARYNGRRWSQPLAPIDLGATTAPGASPRADDPQIMVVDDQVIALWVGEAQLWSSRAPIDNVDTGAWSVPQSVAPEIGSPCCATLVSDRRGGGHLIFSVPLNEGRGIYYAALDSDGEWDEPARLFDAVAAGWASVGPPAIAIEPDGTRHALWSRAGLPGDLPSLGIFYSRSSDGELWSEPVALTERTAVSPRIAVVGEGRIVVLWRELAGAGRWHTQRSDDGGAGWSDAAPLLGFEGVADEARLLAGPAGDLYLIGLAADDSGRETLRLAIWNGARWEAEEPFPLLDQERTRALAATLQATLGELTVAYASEAQLGLAGTSELWSSRRTVPASEATPLPTFTPVPTATAVPSPSPTPAVTPTPRTTPLPEIGDEGGLSQSLTLALSGLLVALLVGGVFWARIARR